MPVGILLIGSRHIDYYDLTWWLSLTQWEANNWMLDYFFFDREQSQSLSFEYSMIGQRWADLKGVTMTMKMSGDSIFGDGLCLVGASLKIRNYCLLGYGDGVYLS